MLFNRSHFNSGCNLETLEKRTLLSDAVITTADYDYLSSMRPVAATNGYGSIERDRSNGERAAGDGSPMSIGGRFYKKGLGLHSDAELHYKLGGKYRSFVSDVGIDDEVGDSGSVVFQVFADGARLYDSGVMYGSSRSRRINVDVSGMNELVLVVRDAGDGSSFDHADFGGARVIRPTGVTPTVTGPADVTLDEARGYFSVDGSFSDVDGGPWVGTIDWGDGRARQYLELQDDKSFSIGHWFPTSVEKGYTVTIRISNGHAVGISKFNVVVNNIAPESVGLAGETNSDGSFNALAGLPFTAGGMFSDPGAFGGETYVASVDYGDGTPVARPKVDGRFFDVNHVYQTPGTYTVTTTVTDSNGDSGIGKSTVIVTQPVYKYVSDLQSTGRAGAFANDRASGGSLISINGTRYNKGIGVTADSELVYNLGGTYRTLVSDVGVDDEVDGIGASVAFSVFADGALIYDSGAMTSGTSAKHLILDVRGVTELRLVASHGDTATANDHGDWAGIRLV